MPFPYKKYKITIIEDAPQANDTNTAVKKNGLIEKAFKSKKFC